MMRTQKTKTAFLEANQDLSPRTLEHYSKALDYLERECPKMPKKPEPVRQALNKAHTVWMKATWWSVWSAFFRWCSQEYGIPNPMKRIDRPRVPDVEIRALEPEELARVLAAAGNLQDKAIIALAIDSGIRASEFGRLHILDISSDTIRVWGKGNRQIRVPISPETHHLLQLLLDQDGSHGAEAPLFPDHHGKPLSRYAVYRIVRRCMERAGIPGPKLGPHCLRHSLGKNYIADGGDAFTLQRVMRHRNIATTQKYVNLAMHDVVEQHHRHSPVRGALRAALGIQQSFLDTRQALKEAEAILKKEEANYGG